MSRTALVTGGNRGIGLEVVKQLARQGHKVLLGCRSIDDGHEAMKNIRGNVIAVHIDLSQSSSLRAEVSAIMAEHGPIDILINNGAILRNGSILETSKEDFYESLQVNLTGAFDLIQMVLPRMIEEDYGRIINLGSDWGSFNDGLTGPVGYSVSKAAINALTMNVAHCLPKNIKINSVHPGWVKTDMGGAGAPVSIEKGAETIVWLANAPNIAPSGGFYYEKRLKKW